MTEAPHEPARGQGTLRRKVVFATVAAFALPAIAAVTIFYLIERSSREEEVRDSLSAVATVQEHRVESFLASSQETLDRVTGRTQLQVSLAGIIDRQNARAEQWANALLLDALGGSTTLQAISVVDLDGTVVASTEPSLRGERFPLDPEAMVEVDGGGTRVTLTEEGDRQLLLTAGPVELAGRRLGTVLIETSARPLLSGIVDYTGLGDTGETLLAERTSNGDARLLAPVRDGGPDAPGAGEIVPAGSELTLVRALDTQERILTGVEDYRGEEVIAATRYVPEADWAIVVKMDAAEAMASITRLRTLLIVALLSSLVGAAVLSSLLTHSLLRPFAELERMARAVLRGDRQHRVEVRGNDERATVARALNQMTDELVTANERLEAAVAERTTQLEDANRELSAFTYSVSHDLRAPLRSIDGFSQAVLEDYGDELDDTGRRHLERVRSGAQRMGRLIDDLMELSRLSRSEIRREPIDLREVASEIADELREGEPDRAVQVHIDEDLSVRADRGLMSVALRNLLANAWKFTRDRAQAQIEVSRIANNGTVTVAVRDNGAGFDPEYASELFRPFGRLHRTDEFPGTGIGLATVERVVHLHGGRVWAEGTPDGGAAFYFTVDEDEEASADGHDPRGRPTHGTAS